jgi:HlyD family secretion protein
MLPKLRRSWLYIVLAILLSGAAWFLFSLSAGKPKQTTASTSAQGAVSGDKPSSTASRTSVRAFGRIEPGQGIVNISAPSDCCRLLRLEVGEGQVVKAADVLARLDTYPEALAAVNLARSQLANARERLSAETANGEAKIQEAEVHLQKVKTTGPLEILAQEAKVRSAELEHALQTRDLQRMKTCGAECLPDQSVDRQDALVQKAKEDLSNSRSVLDHLKTQYETTMEEAKAQLASARADLVRVRSAISIDVLEREVERAQAQLSRTTITAPIDGQILKIHTWPGEKIGSTPILKMGDVANMYAVAEVYESDVRLVRPGQKATIRSPALSEVLTGKVSQVGLTVYKNDVLGIDPGAATDFRVVEARILLDDHRLAQRFNHLQVDIEINVTQ